MFLKKKTFLLPSEKAGRKFIVEIYRLINKWLNHSLLKDIGFKAITVMPNLQLQKPSQKSKSENSLSALERDMDLSHSGKIID